VQDRIVQVHAVGEIEGVEGLLVGVDDAPAPGCGRPIAPRPPSVAAYVCFAKWASTSGSSAGAMQISRPSLVVSRIRRLPKRATSEAAPPQFVARDVEILTRGDQGWHARNRRIKEV
jgi:hypothetical protein